MQYDAHSVRRMHHLLHFITITTFAVIMILKRCLRLTEQLSDILNALRLLLVFTHHAQGRSQELLAVLNLQIRQQSARYS